MSKGDLVDLSSNIDRAEGSEELIGKIIDQRYRVEKLLDTTRKSWVFLAEEVGEITPGRDVALKVLKPGQEPERKEQFAEEAKTLGELGNHPNIVKVYGGGKDENYFYIAMEYVPGDNLQKRVDNNETFSLEKIVCLSHSLAEAVDFCHSHEVEHNDIKLKNLKEKEDESDICAVLDFGSKFTRDKNSDDIYAMGSVLEELLKHRENPKQKIPKVLEQIVNKAKSQDYSSPEDFKNAIENYRRDVKKNITRRKFLKVAGSGLVLTGLGYSSYKFADHRNSIGYVVEQLAQIEATDYEKINPLFKELLSKIIEYKIDWLVEDEKIPSGKFPYATIENGSWFLTEGGYWTEGFWPGILWNAYEFTGKEKYKQWATEWTNAVDFTERESNDIRSIRFYYSHAKAFELTGDEFFRDKALRATEFMVSRFNENGDFIQTGGKISDSDAQKIFIDAMTTAIPLLSWAYTETNNDSLRDIITRHCDATIQCNVNEDGSTIQLVEFNPRTMAHMRGIKSHGFSENSCLSRGQARVIKGFITAHKSTNKKRFLETAERCADYFISNLPEDNVPFYDFKDPDRDIPKDSSAASIASSGLLDLFDLTSKTKYKIAAHGILKSLSTMYLSTDLENYQGIIMHGCSNRNSASYTNNSLINGDYHFLEALAKL